MHNAPENLPKLMDIAYVPPIASRQEMATNQKMAENRITGYEKFGVISLHKVDRSSESPLSPFSMSFASSSIAENRFDQIKPEKRLVKKKTNNHILEFILV